MKKELNLQLEGHRKMIGDVVEQALKGISQKEIMDLRKICEENRFEYFQRIELKYIVGLGLLGLDYQITQEIKEAVFFLIHDIIHQITITDEYDESELLIAYQ